MPSQAQVVQLMKFRAAAKNVVTSSLDRAQDRQSTAGEHQDIAVDLTKGRVYLPRQDIARFGYSIGELRAGVVNAPFIALMRHEVEFARGLLRSGAALHDLVALAVAVSQVESRLVRQGCHGKIERQSDDRPRRQCQRSFVRRFVHDRNSRPILFGQLGDSSSSRSEDYPPPGDGGGC